MSSKQHKLYRPPSTPAVIGIVITFLWLLLGAFFVSHSIGWGSFLEQPIDAVGSFFEGAFAPLLFLWIVVGFFIQQQDIAQNTYHLQRQAQRVELQTFLTVSSMVTRQLGLISGQIYSATQGPKGNGRETEESLARLWSVFQTDDKVFIRKLFSLSTDVDEQGGVILDPMLFIATPTLKLLTDNYMRIFTELLEEAENADPSHAVRDAILQGTGQGILYAGLVRMARKLEIEFAIKKDLEIILPPTLG